MMTMQKLEQKLQRADRKQEPLYLFLQFHFADADLVILCHDLLADDPDRAPGGRRQPETDDRDLRTRVIRMHRLYRLCGKPVLPQEVPSDRNADGARRIPPPTGSGAVP